MSRFLGNADQAWVVGVFDSSVDALSPYVSKRSCRFKLKIYPDSVSMTEPKLISETRRRLGMRPNSRDFDLYGLL